MTKPFMGSSDFRRQMRSWAEKHLRARHKERVGQYRSIGVILTLCTAMGALCRSITCTVITCFCVISCTT